MFEIHIISACIALVKLFKKSYCFSVLFPHEKKNMNCSLDCFIQCIQSNILTELYLCQNTFPRVLTEYSESKLYFFHMNRQHQKSSIGSIFNSKSKFIAAILYKRELYEISLNVNDIWCYAMINAKTYYTDLLKGY